MNSDLRKPFSVRFNVILGMAVLGCVLSESRPSWGLFTVASDGSGAVLDTSSGERIAGDPSSKVYGWDNVGQTNSSGGTGVYLGNGWVLTANHFYSSGITLKNQSGVDQWYTIVSNSRIRILNSTTTYSSQQYPYQPADLCLFKINGPLPNLPSLTLATSDPRMVDNSLGPNQVTVIGTGYSTAVTTPKYWSYNNGTWTQLPSATGASFASYTVGGTMVKRWGDNVLGGDSDVGGKLWFGSPYGSVNLGYLSQFYGSQTLGPEFYAPTNSYGLTNRMFVQSGDSGSAMFVKTDSQTYQLAGIMVGYNSDTLIPSTNRPANEMFLGYWNYAVSVAAYAAQITAAQTEWKGTAGGNWSTAGNWLTAGNTASAAPNGITAVAQILSNITTPSTLTLDVDVTLGMLNLNNSNNLTLNASGSHKLTFDNGHLTTNGIAASLAGGLGQHVINAPIMLGDNLNVIVDSSTMTFNGVLSSTIGAKILTKSGAGTLYINAPYNMNFGGVKVSASNGQVVFNAGGTGPLYLETSGATGVLAVANVGLTASSLNMTGGTLQSGTTVVTLAGDVTAVSSGTTAAQITGQLSLGSATRTFTVTAGTGGATTDLSISAQICGTSVGLIKAGTGTLTLTNSANSFTGGTTVNAGKLIANIPEALGSGGPLSISGTATTKINPAAGVLKISSLTLASTAKLDLSDNDLLITGGTLATVIDRVKTGAITSSTATPGLQGFAVVSADDYLALPHTGGALKFDNQTVVSGNIVVKYTYQGDANLDGDITMDDYLAIDTGYLFGGSGYTAGDFNYDNVINASDYALIDNSFRLHGNPLANDIITLHANWFGADYTDALAALTEVPEPATGILLLAGLTTLLRQKQKRR